MFTVNLEKPKTPTEVNGENQKELLRKSLRLSGCNNLAIFSIIWRKKEDILFLRYKLVNMIMLIAFFW